MEAPVENEEVSLHSCCLSISIDEDQQALPIPSESGDIPSKGSEVLRCCLIDLIVDTDIVASSFGVTAQGTGVGWKR